MGGVGGVDGDACPGEGQTCLAGACRLGGEGVEGGVEEGGVDGVAGWVGVVREGDFGVEGAVGLGPDRGDALEGGSVLVAVVGQSFVEVGGVDRSGAGGRPLGQGLHGLGGIGGEGAGGVAGPGLGVAVRVVGVGAGVDGDLPAACVRGAGELEVAAGGLVQDEGGVEGEFVEVGGAGVVSGVQGQVDQGGAGQQDGAGYGVVGEPGVGLQADAAGQDGGVGVGELGDRAQQGVVCCSEAQVGGVRELGGVCNQ